MADESDVQKEANRLMKMASEIVDAASEAGETMSPTRLATLLVRDHGVSEEQATAVAGWVLFALGAAERTRLGQSSPEEPQQEADELNRAAEERKRRGDA
jgi:hypothetical protein